MFNFQKMEVRQYADFQYLRSRLRFAYLNECLDLKILNSKLKIENHQCK